MPAKSMASPMFTFRNFLEIPKGRGMFAGGMSPARGDSEVIRPSGGLRSARGAKAPMESFASVAS